MNESVHAHILWQIERGLRYPSVRVARSRITWISDAPLCDTEGELLAKMSHAMRLAPSDAKLICSSDISGLQPTDLFIILGHASAVALNLQEYEAGKVSCDKAIKAPFLLTHHPRELLLEPNLKRQTWAELQVAMAYLKL